jgi:hypothetical protein
MVTLDEVLVLTAIEDLQELQGFFYFLSDVSPP